MEERERSHRPKMGRTKRSVQDSESFFGKNRLQMVERGAARDNGKRTKVIVLSSSSNRDVRYGMPYPPFFREYRFSFGSGIDAGRRNRRGIYQWWCRGAVVDLRAQVILAKVRHRPFSVVLSIVLQDQLIVLRYFKAPHTLE